MKRLILPITLSLCANVLLAGLYLRFRSAPTAAPETVPAPSSEPAGVAKPRSPKAIPASAATPAMSAAPSDPMRWEKLATTDLKEFIRRLRAAGCPEQTVKDIILAEVNRRFATRQKAIWDYAAQLDQYWKNPQSSKDQRERSKRSQELEKERTALLVDLFGEDPRKAEREQGGYIDYMEQRLAGIPKEKRDAVTGIVDQFQEKQQELYEKNRGFQDAESRAEQRQLYDDQLKALAAILTPEELRSWEVRSSQNATQVQMDMRGFDASEKEYLALFDIRKQFGDSVYMWVSIEAKEDRDKVTAAVAAQKEAVAAALGPERAKEYERGRDYSYQQLSQLAVRLDLPADSAKKVYDYKETAENAAKEIRANKDLSPEIRQQALAKIRTETESAVKEAIGQEGLKRYRNQGGYWINNIAPTPPPIRR